MKILLGWKGFPRKTDEGWIDPEGKWMPYDVEDFEELAETLREFSEIPRASDDVSKRQHHWFNPVVLNEEGLEYHKRTKMFVSHLSPFICVDIDEQGYDFHKLDELFDGVEIILHTTTKSRKDFQRWRVVIKLDREYSGTEYEAIWRYLQVILNGQMDEATKDYTRLSFMPAKWEGAYNEFHYLKGKAWIVDDIVAKAPPAPVVQIIQDDYELRQAPDGTPIITDRMISNNIVKTGRMFKILCAAAAHYKSKGWDLPITDLYMDAQRVSMQIGHKETTPGELLRECEKAKQHIFSVVQTETKSIDDIAKSAMDWVKKHIEPNEDNSYRRKMADNLYFHGSIKQTPYIPLGAWKRFEKDRDLAKLACAALTIGRRYGKELKMDQIITILTLAQKEINK